MWIAHELGAVLLESGEDGKTCVLSGSPALSGLPFEDALLEVVGQQTSAAVIRDLVKRAEDGAGSTLSLEDGLPGRLLAWRDGAKTRALFVPYPDDAQIARKAAAADLAAGVTHEIANSLTAIAGWSEMAANTSPLPERTRQALDVVQRSARDALAAARGLLRTMRETGETPSVGRISVSASAHEQTNVVLVIHEVLDTLRPELEEARIGLDVELGIPVSAPIAPAALRLIVSNLVRNAFEALDTGGRIRVGIRVRAERFVLTIADDGPGMTVETLAHAFDRYFTTKLEGTGLGLALVRDTVNEAGGRVEVKSRSEVGTRFEVSLPRTYEARMSMRAPTFAETTTSGVHPKPALLGRRILVIDDDEALRTMIKTALELQGAHITTGVGYQNGLEIDGEFDLALIDLTLGDGRGDRLMHALRKAGSFTTGVLMSGSIDTERVTIASPDAVLRKPFRLDEMLRLLESLLAASAVGAEAE